MGTEKKQRTRNKSDARFDFREVSLIDGIRYEDKKNSPRKSQPNTRLIYLTFITVS